MWNRSVFAWIDFLLSTYKEYIFDGIPVSWFPRNFGSIPISLLLGDCDQLSPVSGLPLFSSKKGDPSKLDEIGRQTFRQYIEGNEDDGEKSYSFIMSSVIRTEDPTILDLLESFRNGNVTKEQADFIMSRRLEILPNDEYDLFEREALYVVPTWKDSELILKKYLLQFDSPIATVGCNKKPGHVNHIDRDITLPQNMPFVLVLRLCFFAIFLLKLDCSMAQLELLLILFTQTKMDQDLIIFLLTLLLTLNRLVYHWTSVMIFLTQSIFLFR